MKHILTEMQLQGSNVSTALVQARNTQTLEHIGLTNDSCTKRVSKGVYGYVTQSTNLKNKWSILAAQWGWSGCVREEGCVRDGGG